MHKVSSQGFHGFWGDFINEGVTQLFADRLLDEHGLSIVTDHQYRTSWRARRSSSRSPTSRPSRAAYFQNDGKLREAVMKKLNIDLHTLSRDGRQAICAQLP